MVLVTQGYFAIPESASFPPKKSSVFSQSVTSRLETSQYRDFSQFFESIGLGLENFGLEKSLGIGLENI